MLIFSYYKLLLLYHAECLSNKILHKKNTLYFLTKISCDSLQKTVIAEVLFLMKWGLVFFFVLVEYAKNLQ